MVRDLLRLKAQAFGDRSQRSLIGRVKDGLRYLGRPDAGALEHFADSGPDNARVTFADCKSLFPANSELIAAAPPEISDFVDGGMSADDLSYYSVPADFDCRRAVTEITFVCGSRLREPSVGRGNNHARGRAGRNRIKRCPQCRRCRPRRIGI